MADESKVSEFLSAAGDGCLERVQELIEEGMPPDVQDSNGYSAYHAAVCSGNLDLLAYLLKLKNCVNLADADQDTPLHHLAFIPPNYVSESNPNRLATLAVQSLYGDSELGEETPMQSLEMLKLAELLVEYGADVNLRNANGQSGLDIALEEEIPELADWLRKHGAKERLDT